MPQNRNNRTQEASYKTDNGIRKRTLVVTAVLLIFLFGLLIYQLYGLEIRDVEQYRAEAVNQQLSDQTLAAERGAIYSSSGKLLAKNLTTYKIIANTQKCDDAAMKSACEFISEQLNGEIDADSIYEKYKDYLATAGTTDENGQSTDRSQYMVITTDLSKETAEAITSYASKQRDENGNRLLSIYSEEIYQRSYPNGAFLSSVLGFCGYDDDGQFGGQYGLEKSYNDVLAGTDGRSIGYTNAMGEALADSEADVHEAIDGNDLYLTINDEVQNVLESYLSKAVEDYNVMGRACGIVMNVNTGAVYGMATVQQFDPNNPNEIYDTELAEILDHEELSYSDIDLLQSRLGEDEVEEIVADGKLDDSEKTTLQGMMRYAQWKNKTITELYYPGSVFKLITASAGLDSGIMQASDTFYCSGSYVMSEGTEWEHTYHCANETTHGMLDMAGALNHSCNIYFVQAGQKMSSSVFYAYEQAFGLFETTGIDLPYETPWMSYHDEQDLEEYATALTSAAFGQGQTFTPLQIATAVAAITNGGYLVTPHVVDYIADKNGNMVEQIGTNVRRQVISEEVSSQICSMMADIVASNDDGNYHGGANAYVAGYNAGGKSGTAEIQDRSLRGDGDYHKASSFVEVLPIDDPEILVYVMMDDPRWNNDYASQIVAPVVGNIVSEIAPLLGIEKSADYDADKTVTVPNCVGVSWTNAQVYLNKVGLSHTIIGGNSDILFQYPYAGTSVPQGTTVYLYTAESDGEDTTVPNVIGKSTGVASQMLRGAGLNVQIEDVGGNRIVRQSIEGGSTEPMGTIVVITTGTSEESQQQPEESEATEEVPAEEVPAEETPQEENTDVQ